MLVTVVEYDNGYTPRLVNIDSIEDKTKIKIISIATVEDDEEVKPPYSSMSFYITNDSKEVSIRGFLESKGYTLDKSKNVWVHRTITKPIEKIKRKRKK